MYGLHRAFAQWPSGALNVPAGQWHTVRARESGSVILECKEGAYEPFSDTDILKVQAVIR